MCYYILSNHFLTSVLALGAPHLDGEEIPGGAQLPFTSPQPEADGGGPTEKGSLSPHSEAAAASLSAVSLRFNSLYKHERER